MIIHVVMIKFKDGVKRDKILEIKKDIEELKLYIPQLKNMEVGLNFAKEDRAMDLVLIASFDSKEDLEIYAKDKTHQKVIEKIKEVASYSKVVDYEKVT
ncbi:MAG: Dabb family protein [Epsilonproteobacteria bacterium]|nr:Dabb family protein [Campylobacterota bacterium]